MDCSDIEDALLAGEEVTGGLMAEHIAGCETCRYLVSDGAPLAQALAGGRAAEGAGGELGLGGLEAAVFERVRSERGWVASLRERSRAMRVAVVAGVVALEALLLFGLARRVDWSLYPPLRMAVAAGGLAVVSLVLGWLALRPIWLRPLAYGVELAVAAAAIGFPLLLAVLPELPTVPPFDAAGPLFALRCFAIGSALGAAVFVVARLLDRGGATRWGVAAAAMAGGVSGALALQLECPVNHPWHLIVGHALPVVALAGVALLVWRRR